MRARLKPGYQPPGPAVEPRALPQAPRALRPPRQGSMVQPPPTRDRRDDLHKLLLEELRALRGDLAVHGERLCRIEARLDSVSQRAEIMRQVRRERRARRAAEARGARYLQRKQGSI